jgi:2,3-dihydroxybiphenyl 1,2-dioxygenase
MPVARPAVASLGYVNLDVADMPAWLKFTGDIFGLEAKPRDGGIVDLKMDEYHHRFTLYPAAQNRLRSIGWEMSSPENLLALVEKLKAAGHDVTEASPALKAERKVRDLWRFHEPHLALETELFYGPSACNVPLKPARAISGYNTGALGIGHVVFSAADPRAAVAFYQDMLGFRISDYIIWDDKDATFLHCNARHHTLAIMNEFGPLKGGDLNHIMLEAKDFNDVGYAYDLVRDAGYPVMLEMGKHSNDHMQSFYVHTPSGFAFEYGFGGRTIGEDWQVRTYDQPMLFGHRQPA